MNKNEPNEITAAALAMSLKGEGVYGVYDNANDAFAALFDSRSDLRDAVIMNPKRPSRHNGLGTERQG